MSAAPFVTVLTPLAVLPVLAGMAIAGFECINIIAARYGVDLAGAFPNLNVHTGIEAPILLAGVALFAAIQGWKMRGGDSSKNGEPEESFGPLGWLERLSIAAALLALVTIPYWLSLPVPEVWVGVGVMIIWASYKKIFS